jgi:phosphoribosylanthranilate isomerase
VHTAGLRAAQLHGQETAEDTKWVRARVPLVIKAFRAGERTITRFEEFGADYLMVDGDNPGSGQVFDWRLAEGVVDPRRLIVSGGLTPENVAAAISHLRPWGVDVDSGVEAAPGVKDPGKLREFIGAAHAAAQAIASEAGDDDGGRRSGPEGEPSDGGSGPFDWQDE